MQLPFLAGRLLPIIEGSYQLKIKLILKLAFYKCTEKVKRNKEKIRQYKKKLKSKKKKKKIEVSHAGNRTPATAVRAPDPNH